MALSATTQAVCGSLAPCSGLYSIEKPSTFSTFHVQPVPCLRLTVPTVCASSTGSTDSSVESFGRRQATLTGLAAVLLTVGTPLPARADFLADYTSETQAVIEKVRSTLTLEKDDPSKDGAVASLRELSNSWVAKYRREKAVAGKPSFSNMYSVLNAISGHYISFGNNYPIPKKRAQRILEEVVDAERALSRGR